MITKEDNKLIQIKKPGKRKNIYTIIRWQGDPMCDSAFPLKLSTHKPK